MKVLFLLKKNNNYNYGTPGQDPSTGLFNSASILASQLSKHLPFVRTKVKICIDGNSIDREIHQYRPDVCILEAIWVTGAKLAELIKLHPRVKFVVRIHSELPFLANEGHAIATLNEYKDLKVTIGFNSKDTVEELKNLYKNIAYMPNVYEDVDLNMNEFFKYLKNLAQYTLDPKGWSKLSWECLNIGCFGAVRPMKNQLIQAVAAINYADKAGVKLYFHMNGSRVEQRGDSVLKNLVSLFEGSKHDLILHPWKSREEFLELIGQMDLGMQVSMNESFNIVTADFVKQGVAVVVSDSIKWCPEFSQTSTIEGKKIEEKIGQALRYNRMFERGQTFHLKLYNTNSLNTWGEIFENI